MLQGSGGQNTRKPGTGGLLLPNAFRRKRCILFAVLVGMLFVLLFTLKWPGATIKWGQVDEIYGFLHVVTSESEQGRGFHSPGFQISPYTKNDMSLYAGAGPLLNWRKEKARIDREYPVIVFSKSYCPYSERAKTLLASYNIQPPPRIIEVDLREDGTLVKQFLTRLTQHSTFPNIIIKGRTIGGSDDLHQLHDGNLLRTILVAAGATVTDGS